MFIFEETKANNIIEEAVSFATQAHEGQVRKYTGKPYVSHPIEVGMTLKKHGFSEATIVAGILHDTIEDTDVLFDDISFVFGPYIAGLVMEVTKVSVSSDGDRKTRKDMDQAYYAKASLAGKAIKMADIISNTGSVVKESVDFAVVYVPEQKRLVEKLGRSFISGMWGIADEVQKVVQTAEADLVKLEK